VHHPSEYTLSLRVEAASLDFDAIDNTMGAAGSHQHIDRQPTRFRRGQSYDRWEIEARDVEGAIRFKSIDEAFSALSNGNFASVFHSVSTTEDRVSYWWCGCFHSVTSAHTLIAEETFDLLVRSNSPIFLDTFYSPTGSDNSDPSVAENPSGDQEEPSGHRYRFGLADGELCLSESEWGPYFEDFSEGMQSKLQELAHPIRCKDVANRSVKRILCEHIQYSYDGGPKLGPDHAAAIALLGLELAILWRKG